MIEHTILTSELCSRDCMREIKTSAFYSRNTILFLPMNIDKLIDSLSEFDNKWIEPKLHAYLLNKGLIQPNDDADEYLDSISEAEADRLGIEFEQSLPKDLELASRANMIWRCWLKISRDDLKLLSDQSLLTFPMETEFGKSAGKLQDLLNLSHEQLAKFGEEPSFRKLLSETVTGLPYGLPGHLYSVFVAESQKEPMMDSSLLSLSKKERKAIRKVSKDAGFLLPNLLYSLLVAMVCKVTDAVPASSSRSQLDLINWAGGLLGSNRSDDQSILASHACAFVAKRSLPSIGYLPTHELLSVREKCLPELERLWCELKKVSWQLNSVQPNEILRLQQLIETEVDPAISDLKASTKNATKNTLRNLRSLKPALLQTSTAFCMSAYLGLSNQQQAVNSIAVAAAALLPGLTDAVFKRESTEIREKSPYGVVLTLEKLESKAQKIKKKSEKRREKEKRRNRRR